MTPSAKSLLCLQGLSSLSLWIDFFLIFTVPVVSWNISASSVALLAFSLGAPALFIGPIAGALLDRTNIRLSIFLGILSRILTTLGLFLATSFEIFIILAALKGLSNLVYFPAMTMVTRQIINTDNRIDFFSYASLLDQLSKTTTPILAGTLTILLPINYIFLMSAISLSLSALFIKPIWTSLHAIQETQHKLSIKLVLSDLGEGFKLFGSLPLQLKLGFIYSILTALALACYDPHLASFIASLGYPPIVFSWIVSSTAVGAVLAALSVKLKIIRYNSIQLRVLGLCFFSLGIISALTTIWTDPLEKHLYFLMSWLINGFGYELLIISSNVILQDLCPPSKLGRVSSSLRSLQMLCIVTGPTAGGFLITNFGRITPFIFSSALAGLTAIAAIFLLRRTTQTAKQTQPQPFEPTL